MSEYIFIICLCNTTHLRNFLYFRGSLGHAPHSFPVLDSGLILTTYRTIVSFFSTWHQFQVYFEKAVIIFTTWQSFILTLRKSFHLFYYSLSYFYSQYLTLAHVGEVTINNISDDILSGNFSKKRNADEALTNGFFFKKQWWLSIKCCKINGINKAMKLLPLKKNSSDDMFTYCFIVSLRQHYLSPCRHLQTTALSFPIMYCMWKQRWQ
jgi:hypothetical protein